MKKGILKKRTKIVATISDKNCEPDFLRQLFEAGMDVVRINSAHLDADGVTKIVTNTRAVSDKIAVLIDTKGPEIRTTLCDGPLQFIKGQSVKIAGNSDEKTTLEVINLNYRDIASHVAEGNFILIDDGELEIKLPEGKAECLWERSRMTGCWAQGRPSTFHKLGSTFRQ